MVVLESFARRVTWFRDVVESRLRGPRPVVGPERTDAERDDHLCGVLRLDPEHLPFVWACVCAAADPLLHGPLVSLGGSDARKGLSLATYAALVGDERVAGLARWLASDPLVVRLGLIAPAIDGLLPGSTPYLAANRLVSYFAGADRLDPTVVRVGGLVHLPVPYEIDRAHRELIDRIARALSQSPPALLVLIGPHGVGRRTLVAAALRRIGRQVVAIDGGRAAPDDNLVYALHREALLLDAVPLIADAGELLAGDRERLRQLGRAIDAAPGSFVVTTNDPGFDCPVGRPRVRIHMQALDASSRAALWRASLAGTEVEDHVISELAMRYQVGPGTIRSASLAARNASTTDELDRAQLVDGVRSTVVERFGGLAERLEVTDRWDDVVLTPETRDQIEALVSRVRHAYRVYEEWRFPRNTARGGGVAALFSGPPGTGKTLVAGIISRELDRDLFRVDLSRIVSKWVGETEKQLSELFDAAEASDALLLFDEADSLFAKRTEVKSSSDRYANLEVNYLLQRIETFGGVTILTTNLDTSIDAALRRRLAAHVVFWPPEHDERLRLWQRFATCGAPTRGTLQLDVLAEEFPDMTGANIRNASLAAAFLAAAGDGAISQELLVRAARSEYRAMGRVFGRK